MNMWQKVWAWVLCCSLCVVGVALPLPSRAEVTPIAVALNGQTVAFPDQGAVVLAGRTLVPIRFISEELGAQVFWDGETRQVSIYSAAFTLRFDLAHNQITQSGQPVQTDVYPTIIGGRTMVPLRLIAETMGLKVHWDQGRNQVAIDGELSGLTPPTPIAPAAPAVSGAVVLGNERLLGEYAHLIENKRLGLITNHTGVNRQGISTAAVLAAYPKATLVAAYAPEHGLDGTIPAGKYVASYTDNTLGIPVYSLYGQTREPSAAMLAGIDVLIFDMQDIGSRTYTYMSTLNYCMRAAAKAGLPIIVLDRPNPVGGVIVEGPMMVERYKTFVGVDTLPLAHGMTAGELAGYFNRNIGAALQVVPMSGYRREMIYQDTGLPFVQTSPNIPTIDAAFKYMATGMGEGTGVGQADKFDWVGAKGLDAQAFAAALNAYNLPGVNFAPEVKNDRGGVRLHITDYHAFNPARTSIYILLTADRLQPITPPAEVGGVIPMFEKIWGGTSFGQAILQDQTPEQYISSYQDDLSAFRTTRQAYLLYP